MRALTHLPHRVSRRRDAKVIAGLLELTGLPLDAPLGAGLAELLGQRTQDCRDLFALRGVRTRRETLLVMAGRALAQDPDAALRLAGVPAAQGRALLAAISLLIDNQLAPHLPRPSIAPCKPKAQPRPQAPTAPPAMCALSQFPVRATRPVEAAHQPELLAA